MATRQLLTVDEIINCVVSDDEDYDDPDEPMMEGSDDDDFSDLELDDNMDDGDTSCSASNSSPTSRTHSPPTSPFSIQLYSKLPKFSKHFRYLLLLL